MSKPKGGKDKKQDNYDQLQKDYETQKRELLDATFTLKKLEQRLNFLTQDNYRLEQERENQNCQMNEKIEELSIKNETNEKRLITMRNDLTNSEVENKKLLNTINLLEKNMADERADKNKEYDEMKKNHAFEVTKFENMLTDYKLYMTQRDSREKEISELYEAKQIQVANRIREVADKEREKVQATDKIRDEMGNKLREMRQNLLSLKKEELETTTRLTMLQNHQLTTQLEYQSKQTEKIVFKNEELEQTIVKLKQDLDIHKQIEDELAKRSHFSKGVIKKLHSKVEQLEEEVERPKLSGAKVNTQSNESSTQLVKEKSEKPEKAMTQALDQELQKWQKKHAQLQSRYDGIKKEKQQLVIRWESSQRSKNELFNCILKTFKSIQGDEQKSNETKENQHLSLHLNKLKQRPPSEWTFEETEAVLQILLATCQPYINQSNLSIPQLSKIIVFDDIKGQEKNPTFPRLSTKREKMLFSSASEKKIVIDDDLCMTAKNQLCDEKYSINIASKMVSHRLREWGRQVPSKNRATLNKKYQLSCTYRT